jgi:hypothetical protein
MGLIENAKDAYEAGAAGHFTPIAYSAALGIALCLVCVLVAATSGKAPVFSLRTWRRTLVCARFLLLSLWLLQLPLLYMVLFLSPPVLMPVTYLGQGVSWIFGWGRVLTGLLLLPLGFFANVHSAFRFAGFAVAAVQYVMDAFSAITLADYDDCVSSDQCTLNEDYTMQTLRLYHTRDLLCVLLDMSLMCFYGYFFALFGCTRDSDDGSGGGRGFRYSQLHGDDTIKARRLDEELAKLRQRNARKQ